MKQHSYIHSLALKNLSYMPIGESITLLIDAKDFLLFLDRLKYDLPQNIYFQRLKQILKENKFMLLKFTGNEVFSVSGNSYEETRNKMDDVLKSSIHGTYIFSIMKPIIFYLLLCAYRSNKELFSYLTTNHTVEKEEY